MLPVLPDWAHLEQPHPEERHLLEEGELDLPFERGRRASRMLMGRPARAIPIASYLRCDFRPLRPRRPYTMRTSYLGVTRLAGDAKA